MAKKTKKSQAQPQPAKSNSAPIAVGSKQGQPRQPQMVSKPDGSTIITHSEYCFDVDTISSSSLDVYPLNPQRPVIFTWLSAIATRYEMYRFRKLKFTYKPSCPTTTSGYVVMGFDFDALDYNAIVPGQSTGPSKAEMLAWKYSTKCSTWQTAVLDVTVDSRLATYRYCDTNSQSRGDARLDLLGNLIIRTLGDNVTYVGEIFVDYTVEFRQPSYKVPPALYTTVESNEMPSGDAWFTNVKKNVGNLVTKIIDKDTIRIEDVGKFLVSMAVNGTSDVNTDAVMTAAQPSGSPSSEFESLRLAGYANGTSTFAQYLLDVVTAPVDLTWNTITGSALFPTMRIATYKES